MFWEQQGLQAFGHRIQITRSQPATQPAFDKHFLQLIQEYNSVHAINLLGSKENETTLSASYSRHLDTTRNDIHDLPVELTNFDFHAQIKARGHDSIYAELRYVNFNAP